MDRYAYKQIAEKAFIPKKVDRLKKLTSVLMGLKHRNEPFKEAPMSIVNRLVSKKAVTKFIHISPVADLENKEVVYILSNRAIYQV